jgi:hypothetical protein
MSERGVTLEGAADDLERIAQNDYMIDQYLLSDGVLLKKHAAKVRAAARVVEAAREQVRHPHNPRSLDALSVALDAFDKEGL